MRLSNLKIIHYPNLKTILAIEKVLKDAELMISREEIKKKFDINPDDPAKEWIAKLKKKEGWYFLRFYSY